MTTRDDDLRIRPGRIQHGNRGGKRPRTFVGEVMRAAKKAGHVGNSFRSSQGRSRSRFGRGRRAALSLSSQSAGRRDAIMTRIVRHQGKRFTASLLAKHVAYLKREGVTRDGQDARMFEPHRTPRMPRLSPSAARTTTTICASPCRRRRRRKWTCIRLHASS
jgi:hypothetical protein